MLKNSSIDPRRLRQLLLLAAAMFFCLAGRLWYLQILRGDTYRSLADRNRLRTVSDACALRGIIYDRTGKEILAANVQRHSIAAIPDEVNKDPRTLEELARILGRPVADIRKAIRKKGHLSYVPVSLVRGVDAQTICLVEENRCRMPGVLVRSEPIRDYPRGTLAAHVLGHVGEITEHELEQVKDDQRFVPGTVTGKTGAERQYDWYLAGHQATQRLEVDARGQVRQKLGVRSGLPGASLLLTLDCELQHKCENFLRYAGKPGAIVVMDVRSGEILALVSEPAFDPNSFSGTLSQAEWDRLANNPRKPLQNRAISSRYPPGSTFKLITAAAGLYYQRVPSGRIECTGSIKIGNRVARCWKAHGPVNLQEAIAQSCDVYFYQLGMRVGINRLERVMRQFGIGQLTGVDLPNEKPGILPSRPWKQRVFGRRWYPGDTANLSIGQGDVAVTPLQMARVTAAVANGGRLVTPHVVRKIIAVDGTPVPLEARATPALGVSPQHLAVIRRGMRSAVTDRLGTARMLQDLPVHVAAKTGSAEIRRDEVPHSWLVTYAPCERPRVAMAIIVEHGGHGSDVAAPIAKSIYEYLWSGDGRTLIASAAPQ